ncbi:MAG: PEP-CTERM sorting domain-containing protein [Planctomycetota bacterium]
MWNWWGNLVVTPEPTTMCLLGLGTLGLLRRRRK